MKNCCWHCRNQGKIFCRKPTLRCKNRFLKILQYGILPKNRTRMNKNICKIDISVPCKFSWFHKIFIPEKISKTVNLYICVNVGLSLEKKIQNQHMQRLLNTDPQYVHDSLFLIYNTIFVEQIIAYTIRGVSKTQIMKIIH